MVPTHEGTRNGVVTKDNSSVLRRIVEGGSRFPIVQVCSVHRHGDLLLN